MKIFTCLLVALIPAFSIAPSSAQAQKPPELSAKILSAKSVYFDDLTRVPAVGKNALAQLKKWGRFRIVEDRTQADLILVLSASPSKGYVIYSGGQTGTIGVHGRIDPDRVPNYNRAAPVRYAYLTVIDPKSGEKLWSADRLWGGLLTGFNSAGERLIKKLEKQTKK